MNRVYNFSAGPSMLPVPVLQKAQADLLDSSAAGDAFSASQGRQPGPDDDQGGDDGSGHPDTDGAPGGGLP